MNSSRVVSAVVVPAGGTDAESRQRFPSGLPTPASFHERTAEAISQQKIDFIFNQVSVIETDHRRALEDSESRRRERLVKKLKEGLSPQPNSPTPSADRRGSVQFVRDRSDDCGALNRRDAGINSPHVTLTSLGRNGVPPMQPLPPASNGFVNASFTNASFNNASFASSAGTSVILRRINPRRPPVIPAWFLWCARVISTILMGVTFASILLDWRIGWFCCDPYRQEAITVGLYALHVPYSSDRDFSYPENMNLFNLPERFIDWVPNASTGPRRVASMRAASPDIGLIYSVDGINSIIVSSGFSLFLLSLALFLQILSTAMYPMHRSRAYPLCQVAAAGICGMTAVVYHFTITGDSESLIRGQQSRYATGYWLVVAVAVLGTLFPATAFFAFGTKPNAEVPTMDVVRVECPNLALFIDDVKNCLGMKDDRGKSPGARLATPTTTPTLKSQSHPSAPMIIVEGPGSRRSSKSGTSPVQAPQDPSNRTEPNRPLESPLLQAVPQQGADERSEADNELRSGRIARGVSNRSFADGAAMVLKNDSFSRNSTSNGSFRSPLAYVPPNSSGTAEQS